MLTPLQRQLIELVTSLPEAAPFALAGGAAVIGRGEVSRTTEDLDYFAADREAVATLAAALETTLREAGLAVEVVQAAEGFVRMQVQRGDERCQIDLAHDTRIRPPEPSRVGTTVALDELAADKVLALFSHVLRRATSWTCASSSNASDGRGFSSSPPRRASASTSSTSSWRWTPSADLPAMRPPTLRGTTWVEYRRKVNVHVVPPLGDLPLQSLTTGHLNSFYADLLASGRADGTGGLAPKTVREVHVILRKALQDAVRRGHVNRNVAQLANPPSQRATAAARRRHMQTWIPAELATFLEHSDDLAYAWILTATTGMRRGEVLGLRWSDVDLDATRLAVRQTLASVDGQPELSEPKTNRSGRVIDLDKRTVAALRTWRSRQADHRRDFGAAWHDLDLVVTREDGLWLHPDWFSELFRRRIAQLGLPPIRLHDLRHTHARCSSRPA